MAISVQNLNHIYSKNGPFVRAAVKDISFEIADGEFVGIIGHTGSGKSTLIQHLNGLLKPDSGHIYVDGIDICEKGYDLRKLRSKVGLVFQYPEYQLFEETVYKDIAYGPSNLSLSNEEIDRRVHDAIHFVGLDEKILNKSPFELSGGQKRRVAIAGVLAMEPDTIILDEPTAGLDPHGRKDLLKRLKMLHQEKNITIIIVSHSMEEIADTVEKVIVLSKGELVMFDTVAEVFKKSALLSDIGLDTPQACSVVSRLKENGLNLPDGVFDIKKIADIIYDLLKGAKDA